MNSRLLSFLISVVFLTMAAGRESAAQSVGFAVAVKQGAELVTVEGTSELSVGMTVSSGDIIKTNDSGQVQLLFDDDTKIVVGPRSQLVIDSILLRPSGTAKRFAINALGGTFRFISGRSEKPVYKIDTPTATMGIRGTVFDFVVESPGRTSVVLLEGELLLCPNNGDCETITGSCAVSRVLSNALDVGILDRETGKGILRDDFRYVTSQLGLLDPFQADTQTCGLLVESKQENKPEIILPDPAPNPDPDPDPLPEPPTDQPGQSGSGNSVSSTGSGNETSNMQFGTGAGHGLGVLHRNER